MNRMYKYPLATPAPAVITRADVEAALFAATTTGSNRKSRKAPVRMSEAQKNSVIYASNCFVRWARSELALVEADAAAGKQKISQQKRVALRKAATSSWTKAKIKRQNKPYEALLDHLTRFLSDSRNWDLPEEADPDDLRPLQDALNDAGWLLKQIVNQPILEPKPRMAAFDHWVTMLADIWLAAGGERPSGEEQTLFFRFVSTLHEHLPSDVQRDFGGLGYAITRSLKGAKRRAITSPRP